MPPKRLKGAIQMTQGTITPDYSKYSNDQLCELALAKQELTGEAQQLLSAELAARKIDGNQVSLCWDRKNHYVDVAEQKKEQHKADFWQNAKQLLISAVIACVLVSISVPVFGFTQKQGDYLVAHIAWVTVVVHLTRRSVWRWPSHWWPR
jgi:hypothetical protein